MATNSQPQLIKYLSNNNLQEVLEAVYSISSQNIFNFGLKLGLRHNTIENFQTKYTGDKKGWLQKILNERLEQEPPLTWHDIVTALRLPSVSEDHLATHIQCHYLTHSQPPSPLPQQKTAELSSGPQQESVKLSTMLTSGAPQSQHLLTAAPAPLASPQPPHYQSPEAISSVVEETVPPAKRPRLELTERPRLEPHSGPSQDQHGIETVPVTHRLVPADPHNDQRSVCRHLSSIPISARRPLQSSTHSSGQTTATAVSPHSEYDDAPSRIVEGVINKYTSDLTRTIGNDLTHFSCKFIELEFITRDASDNIITKDGIGKREKGNQLLSLVVTNSRISHNKIKWLDKFVSAFSCEAAYRDLATSMTEYYATQTTPCLSEPQSVNSQLQCRTTSPLNAFIDYVKTIYRESKVERGTSVVKWPPTPSNIYINLACIGHQSVDGDYCAELTEAMVRDGNVDVILEAKEPIDFSEIAKNISITERTTSGEKEGDERRLILVEGAPGVGKSTFAWEFCRRWGRGEIAKQYQLVLLLRLREERISNAKSLKDLIYHLSENVCQTFNNELEYNLGVNTLIILEGFDELPDICRKGDSVFMDLIAGKVLPLATLLVTSRPWATKKILLKHKNRIYQRIEILGFTDRQITEYIESTLPQDKGSDLKAYLVSHPQIKAGMYIPLNSAIVVTVYEESQSRGYDMPTTLTELYTSLTQTLLLRYLLGHPEYEADSLQTFKDLPPAVDVKFYKLCKLAYDGTFGAGNHVQLIFRDLSSDFDDLGFMDSVTELYVTRGAVSSHNFLHLTFQEFFSAVHISRMPPAEQVEHFKRLKEGRLKMVLRFLAGLSKLNCFSNEEIAKKFLQTPSTCEYAYHMYECTYQYMFKTCDAIIGVDLLQWLFEAQSNDAIEHVLGQKKIGFFVPIGMLPLDFYSLGYCICHSQSQWVLLLEKDVEIDDDVMGILDAVGATELSGGVREVELCTDWNENGIEYYDLSISSNGASVGYSTPGPLD